MIIDVARNYRLHPELAYFDRVSRPGNEAFSQPLQAPDLLQKMDAAGIDVTGVVANVSALGIGRPGGGRILDDNHVDLVAETIAQAPDRLFGWVGINPLGGMATLRYIEHAVKDLGFRAVHVFPHWFTRPVNDRVYYPIYAKCVELGVPIGVQLGIPGSPSEAKVVGTPQAVDDVLHHFPELTMLCLHLGHPWEREWIALARNYVNFHLVADSPPQSWPKVFTDLFWTESVYWDPTTRIIWGTNTTDQERSLAHVGEMDLPERARDAFLGGNARRVFGL